MKRVILILLLLCASVGLQIAARAYTTEIGTEFDDAGHYVAGLMAHDYIVRGFPGNPVEFAKSYYAHYPKIAIGHWPPVFYIIEALWMIVFGSSISSALVLMAVINGVMGLLIIEAGRRIWKAWAPGVLGAVLFIALPVVQRFSDSVMMDTAVALFVFAAALAWGRYLDTGSNRDAIWFVVNSVLAILTKGNGYELALVPPISLLMARRFALMKKMNLWVAAGFIALLCVPWTVMTRHLVDSTFQHTWGFAYFRDASVYYWSLLAVLPGLIVGVFAIGGIALQIIAAVRGTISGIWAALTATVAAVVLFHTIIPMSIDQRYVIAFLPSVILLAIYAGEKLLALLIPARTEMLRASVAALVLLVLFGSTAFGIPKKHSYGFRQAAGFLERGEYVNRVFLCSSEAFGEGMLISEIAERDKPRPQHIVLRASRAFASSGWNNEDYQLRFHNPAEMMQYLASVPVGVLVVDRAPALSELPHHHLLQQTISQYPQFWRHVAGFSGDAANGKAGVDVYQLTGKDPVPHHPIELDVQGTFKGKLQIAPPR